MRLLAFISRRRGQEIRCPLIQVENAQVSPHVAAIIHSAMAITRNLRPASAIELRRALLDLRVGETKSPPNGPSAAAPSPGPTRSSPNPTVRSPEPLPPTAYPPIATMRVDAANSRPVHGARISSTENKPEPLREASFMKPALFVIGGLVFLALVILAGFAYFGRQSGAQRGDATQGGGATNANASVAAASPKSSPSPANPVEPRAGTVVRNQLGMDLVYIPAGSFMMGSANGDQNELPVHKVTINYSYYLGKYEVTQRRWEQMMGTNPSQHKDCSDCPVEEVSWDDVQAFIQRLNELNDGYKYRLPSEAEWEYACRAGTTGDYAGDLKTMAWIGEEKTHSVGQKRPNAWGLADMHGSVWEWCEDWYHETYDGAPTDGHAWVGLDRLGLVPTGGSLVEQNIRVPEGLDKNGRGRVLRGGSWNASTGRLRSAFRNASGPDFRGFGSYGLRVVAVPRTQ